MNAVIPWIMLVGFAFVGWHFLKFYLELQNIMAKVAAVASKEFFDAAESLIQTPGELSNELLDDLRLMLHIAQSRKAPRYLLAAIRNSESVGTEVTDEYRKFASAVHALRPELQDLLTKAISAWMTFVANSSVFYQLAISSELRKASAGKGELRPNLEKAGMSLLPQMHGLNC